MTEINISNLPQILQATDDDVLIINDANSVTSTISFSNIRNSIQALTGQVAFDVGSAASPTIYFSGDSNTGIYQPATDKIGISTAGVTRVFVDDTGSVGLGGEIPSQYNSGANDLVIGNFTDLTDTGMTFVTHPAGENIINFADGTGVSAAAGQLIYDHNTNGFLVNTVGSEALRVTSSQNVYIGTTTGDPDSRLVVSGGAISVDDGNEAQPIINFRSDLDTGLYLEAADTIGITTGGSNRLVVDPNGRLGIGTPLPSADIHVNKADATLIVTDSDATGSPQFKVVAAVCNMDVRVDDNNVAADSRLSLYVDGTELTRLGASGAVIKPSIVICHEASD